MLVFEVLTQPPIHRALVDTALLGPAELVWLDEYHSGVKAKLLPLLDGKAADWLVEACKPFLEVTP